LDLFSTNFVDMGQRVKLDDAAQAARAIQGLDPKLRPVNKSTLLWKCAMQVVIGHAEYDRACKVMQPSTARPDVDADVRVSAAAACASSRDSAAKHGPQLGLGAKLGMQRMAFTAQELFVQGFSASECDAANAFNDASQKMLEAVRKECPHMARLFWMGYCSHSPLVLMRLGKSFAVLLSQERARMGGQVRLLRVLSDGIPRLCGHHGEVPERPFPSCNRRSQRLRARPT
jgi:hypothetical protein